MQELVIINSIIILMDLCLLGLEAASLYLLETLVKGVVYSLKLKLEFAILSKLKSFSSGSEGISLGNESTISSTKTGQNTERVARSMTAH